MHRSAHFVLIYFIIEFLIENIDKLYTITFFPIVFFDSIFDINKRTRSIKDRVLLCGERGTP